jgi:hypothetical protein
MGLVDPTLLPRTLIGGVVGGVIGAGQALYYGTSVGRGVLEWGAAGATTGALFPYQGVTAASRLMWGGAAAGTAGAYAGNALGDRFLGPTPEPPGAPGDELIPTGPLGGNPLEKAVPMMIVGGVDIAGRSLLGLSCGNSLRGTGAYNEGVQGGIGLGKLVGLQIRVSRKGYAIVERHLAQFGEVAENTAMLARLRAALESNTKISGADASFYMHELSEATMMGRGLTYDVAHEAALSKYGVSPFSVYHPEVIEGLPDSFNSAWRAFWGIK